MKMKKWTALLCGIMLALTVLDGCGDVGPDAGFTAFTADTLDGGTFTQKDLKDKDVTIVNFWGTFCGPCLAEMPDLAAYAKILPDNVQLITVCLDASGSSQIGLAREIMDAFEYEGVTLIPGDDPSFQNICNSVQAIPYTVFLDSKGNTVGKSILGGQQDLAASYTGQVNNVLRSMRKAEISVAD